MKLEDVVDYVENATTYIRSAEGEKTAYVIRMHEWELIRAAIEAVSPKAPAPGLVKTSEPMCFDGFEAFSLLWAVDLDSENLLQRIASDRLSDGRIYYFESVEDV